LRKMVEKEIEEQDFDLELVNSIVGES
jgi:hypothetical protein